MADEKKATGPVESKEEAALRDAEFAQEMNEQFAALGKDSSLIRNDETKTLVVNKVIKGPNKLKRFLGVSIAVDTFDRDIKWWGKTYVVDVLNTVLRRASQEEWFNAVDETTGKFNLLQFLTEMADFTSAAMRLDDISNKIDELQEQTFALLETGDIGKNPDGSEKPDLIKMRGLQNAIRDYKAMADKKSNRSKKPAEASVQVS